MFSDFRRDIEISLTECWTSAAAAILYERNFETERFQHFHRGDADVRLVVADECVVPKNDGASLVAAGVDRGAGVSDPGYSMLANQ